MLSKSSFQIGFVLSIAERLNLHQLWKSIVFQGLSRDDRNLMLFHGLSDLCNQNMILWWYEPNYGNSPSVNPDNYGNEEFLKYWHKFIARSDFATEVPDTQNPTLSIEITKRLKDELDKDIYDPWRQEIDW